MTREEAKEILTHNWTRVDNPNYSESELDEAFFMAIEALQAEPTKAVPPSLADVYKWERDIALSQLEEYGIGFAEKKRDDLVSVVRCKDCRFYWGNLSEDDTDEMYGECRWDSDEMPNADDFCSYGERREPDKCE